MAKRGWLVGAGCAALLLGGVALAAVAVVGGAVAVGGGAAALFALMPSSSPAQGTLADAMPVLAPIAVPVEPTAPEGAATVEVSPGLAAAEAPAGSVGNEAAAGVAGGTASSSRAPVKATQSAPAAAFTETTVEPEVAEPAGDSPESLDEALKDFRIEDIDVADEIAKKKKKSR